MEESLCYLNVDVVCRLKLYRMKGTDKAERHEATDSTYHGVESTSQSSEKPIVILVIGESAPFLAISVLGIFAGPNYDVYYN